MIYSHVSISIKDWFALQAAANAVTHSTFPSDMFGLSDVQMAAIEDAIKNGYDKVEAVVR